MKTPEGLNPFATSPEPNETRDDVALWIDETDEGEEKKHITGPSSVTTSSTTKPTSAAAPESEVVTDENVTLYEAFKEIFSESLGFIFFRLLYLAGGVSSIIILGHQNKDALAATSIINSTQTAITFSTTTIIYSVGIAAKGAIAENNPLKVGKIFRQGHLLGFLICIPSILLTYHIGMIYKLCGTEDSIADVVTVYNRYYVFAMPANIIYVLYMQLMLAAQDLPGIATLSAIYTILIFTMSLALNSLGPKGIGLANVIASWAGLLSIVVHLLVSVKYRAYKFLKPKCGPVEEKWDTMKELFRKGLPIGMQLGMEALYLAILSQFLGIIGKNALSASAPVWNVSSVLTPINFNLGHITGMFVRKAIGSKHFKDARVYGNAGMLLSLVIPIIACIIVFSYPKAFVSIFIKNSEDSSMFQTAKKLLYIFGIGLPFDAISNSAAGAVRGYEDTLLSMISEFINIFVLGITFSALLGFETDLRAQGVLLGRVFACGLAALTMHSYWRYKGSVIKDQFTLRKDQAKSITEDIACWCSFLCSKEANPDSARSSESSVQMSGGSINASHNAEAV